MYNPGIEVGDGVCDFKKVSPVRVRGRGRVGVGIRFSFCSFGFSVIEYIHAAG